MLFIKNLKPNLGRVRLGYSGIRIYSGYSAPESRIAGMEIQVFRNENSSQANAYSHYSSYSRSGLIPNERALKYPDGLHTCETFCLIFLIFFFFPRVTIFVSYCYLSIFDRNLTNIFDLIMTFS